VFKNAIVRKPCPELVHGISTAGLGTPDIDLAAGQHADYVRLLTGCGLRVTVLESDGRHPDSTFIEDVAVCTPKCAVITNPGAPSRKGETEGMKEVLGEFYDRIEEIRPPGTLEGGDVMMAGSHCYVGISGRTNREGAGQLIRILQKYGMTGSMIPLKKMLHLKTGLSYLDRNNLLISGEFLDNAVFKRFNRIVVDEEEGYAANSLWVNGTVLVPSGYPETQQKIGAAGYTAIGVDVSEYRKLDGGLSCLSLRF
jgi:dimethylargininase